jgi:hypothetical protein
MTIRVSGSHDASEPQKGNFVKLKNGNEIDLPKDIKMSSGVPDMNGLLKLKINNQAIKGKNVTSFQIDKKYYENINPKKKSSNEFAKRIYKGPINLYSHTGVETSVSSTGRVSNHTYINYYLQSPNIKNGEFTQILNSNKVDNMMLYVKDYKPSLSILNKYNEVRLKSRKTKLILAGSIFFSSALLLATNNETLSAIGAGELFAGVFFLPTFCFFHKIKNRSLPYIALQKYIDNNFSKQVINQSKGSFVEYKNDTNSNIKNVIFNAIDSLKSDYVLLKNGSTIFANPGTGIESSNNQSFKINEKVFTSDVISYQQKEKFFKKINDIKDFNEFACRYIKGKISVYDNTLEVANISRKSKNSFVTSMMDEKKSNLVDALNNKMLKQSFFEKNNNNQLIQNTMRLNSFFSDNVTASKMYLNYKNHITFSKIESYALLGFSLFGYYAMVKNLVKENYNMAGVWGAAASVDLIFIYPSFANNRHKKLNKELLDIVDYYNKH